MRPSYTPRALLQASDKPDKPDGTGFSPVSDCERSALSLRNRGQPMLASILSIHCFGIEMIKMLHKFRNGAA
jgi:hypothetical protein